MVTDGPFAEVDPANGLVYLVTYRTRHRVSWKRASPRTQRGGQTDPGIQA